MNDHFIIRRIKDLLDKHGWSVYRLAQKSELPTTTLYNMFERETIPGFDTLERIVNGFGMTMAQFFAVDEYPDLTERQRLLLERFDELDEEKKMRLEAFLEGLASR